MGQELAERIERLEEHCGVTDRELRWEEYKDNYLPPKTKLVSDHVGEIDFKVPYIKNRQLRHLRDGFEHIYIRAENEDMIYINVQNPTEFSDE